MAWAWVYLAVSVVGAVLVVNAFRPARHPFLVVPSFFAGWYTAEMPIWHIVWQGAATVVFSTIESSPVTMSQSLIRTRVQASGSMPSELSRR